ncbi:MAG: hypothetical protein U0931_13395 [Vulcanimicrobiota bacterium]
MSRMQGRSRNGAFLTGCTGCALILCLLVLVGLKSCGKTVQDPDGLQAPPTPYSGAVRPFRKTEFVARANNLQSIHSIHVSTRKDLICLEASSCYQIGSYSRPDRGWTVVIPNEKVFFRTHPQRLAELRKAGQTRKADMLRAKLDMYAASGFEDLVNMLRREPEQQGAQVWLELRDRFLLRVSKTEFSRIGSLQEGFKRHEGGQIYEYCPELGILFRSQPKGGEGFGLYNVSEQPISTERFQAPSGFTELFTDQPEPRALLEGLMPAGFQLTSVKKVGNQVEETWNRTGGSGSLILLEHCTFNSADEARKFARSRWEISEWNAGKFFWHKPRFAAFASGPHLVRVSLFGHENPEWPLELAHALSRRDLSQ